MIAIIAGTGILPSQACKSLLLQKKDFIVITLFPEDNFIQIEESIPKTIKIIQQPFYKAKTILNILEKEKISQALFIGKVDKQNLLKKFKLDWLTIKLLASLATKSDFSIMNKVAEILQERKIEIIPQSEVLTQLFIKPGLITGKMTPYIEENINYGLSIAKQISQCDIGQTVVVKDKMILAIEAIEGTDACIRRGIELGKTEIIICKSANKMHNTKFDLPTIGSETLKNINPGTVSAIAWQSTHTFIADQEAFIEKANKLGITLISK